MMLSLLMMLASDPVAATSVQDNDLKARMTAEQQTQERCRNGVVMQADGVTPAPRLDGALTMGQAIARSSPVPLRANDLMFRSGDPVQMTLLLERSVDQCSVPISYDVSGPGTALPRFGHGN